MDPDNPKVFPEIINGITMVPLRFFAQNLGCDVKCNNESF
ncbi:MAG: stalk domain-containing protein [Caldisericia bacterium]